MDKLKSPVPYYTRRPEGAGREILKAEAKNEPRPKTQRPTPKPNR